MLSRCLAYWLWVCSLSYAFAAITVYGPTGAERPTGTSSGVGSTAIPIQESWLNAYNAYNNVLLQPPPLPNPLPATEFAITLPSQALNMPGLSIPQRGDFWGFSIEMSVVEQVIGKNASFIQVPFLNLLATVAERAGTVRIRVGGNTQETATLVDSLLDNAMIQKNSPPQTAATNTGQTPTLLYTPELLHLLSEVSSLVNAKWYLGIPMNDTSHLRLQIAEAADAILGDNVLGYQVGNEPDLYASHGHRPPTYNETDYFNEFGVVVKAVQQDQKINNKYKLVAPSLQGQWTPEDLFATGFLDSYASSLNVIAMEHYPDQNCAAEFPDGDFGPIKDPQTVFSEYLTHTSGQKIVSPYLNTAGIAQQLGKEFMMFETNTASCGGFRGVSDSFGAALWAVDYGLQMAYSNFTGALLHVGGQNVSYNPFTPPPTNLSLFNQWTVGPIFYSTLFMSEALGTTNTSRVVDLAANGANEFTPAYAVYEDNALARIALINYMNAQNGVGTINVTISIGGVPVNEPKDTPAEVQVKYLLAPSVSEKEQITWANQTFGGRFQSDGRLSGTEFVQKITCNQGANTCQIPVPAPGAALVFVSRDAQSSGDPTTVTFSTTAVTKAIETLRIASSALATSNGHSGGDFPLSGTSKGSKGGASALRIPLTLVLASFMGALLLIQ
ncbi:Glycoside Hydrolase Family 79 protein [Trametes cinnabarina]|uniref:Glycoside Hydrolase Family 79 protein n=1 Tax=Pycnoporus cinnabarinus TaxID=5643 RepID=A0A060SSY5_PYCCI|nr:Glycoside Hydrolase Family 79 protein [Trametes cinnabarina]